MFAESKGLRKYLFLTEALSEAFNETFGLSWGGISPIVTKKTPNHLLFYCSVNWKSDNSLPRQFMRANEKGLLQENAGRHQVFSYYA